MVLLEGAVGSFMVLLLAAVVVVAVGPGVGGRQPLAPGGYRAGWRSVAGCGVASRVRNAATCRCSAAEANGPTFSAMLSPWASRARRIRALPSLVRVTMTARRSLGSAERSTRPRWQSRSNSLVAAPLLKSRAPAISPI